MSDGAWFYRNGTETAGPCAERELAALLAARTLTPDSLVGHGEPAPWQPLKDVFAFARDVPPPLPAAHERFVVSSAAPGAWIDTAPHPWRRYFARAFDLLIFSSLTWLVVGFVAGALDQDAADKLVAWQEGRGGAIVSAILGVPLGCAWSAVFVGYTGGTPGKWLLGVRIADIHGRPPGLSVAMQREAMVWIVGLGAAIPLISLATLLVSFAHLDKKRRTVWDERLNLVATHRPESGMQFLLGAAAIVMWAALTAYLRFGL